MPDDEEKKAADAEEDVADEGAAEDTASDDNAAEEEKSADGKEENPEAEAEGPKPFANLDLKRVTCFGWQKNPSETCWYNKCLLAQKLGWENSDKMGIELSLKENVDNCYFCIATLDFTDLDDDTPYRAEFENTKMMWKLSIKDSPRAELEMQQIGDFFKSDLMKKAAQRTADLVQRGIAMYNDFLDDKLGTS